MTFIAILSILIAILIAIISLCYRRRIREAFAAPKYFFGLLMTVKNEGMVLDEFIQHYLWQGVDHIYLIDNGSDDNTRDIVEPYIKAGQLSYFFKPDRHMQSENYNELYKDRVRDECKWLAIVDADEFIYGRTQGQTLNSYLRGIDDDKVAAVSMGWKMFGSSGHHAHPPGVRKYFTRRRPGTENNGKSIINTYRTVSLVVHSHIYTEGSQVISNPPELALNHYAIMSREYFEKIKMTRGDVGHATSDTLRDWTYFKQYDENTEELDTELADLL
jgi:glycosyltransferase involved in cell wall biosynthesis